MSDFLLFFVRWRRIFVPLTLILTLISLFFIKSIHLSGSTKKFFIKNDPDYFLYEKSVKKFGSDNSLVIAIKDENLFEYEKLKKISKLIDKLSEVDGVEYVDSLFNKQNIIYRDYELHSELFIDPDNIPKSKKTLEQIKKDALNNPLINGNLIGDNGKILFLNVVAKNSDDSQFNIVLVRKIRKLLKEFNSLDNTLFGSPYINEQVINYILHDTFFTVPFAILVIFLTILYNIKSFKLTLIPLTTSALSIIIVLGFMGVTGIPLTILTAVIPALIILIGTTEDSYLITEFVEENREGADKEFIIKAISAKLGLAIVLTATTTIVGFISIYLNKIIVLQEFAIVAGFGLFVNFIITLIFVPNMLYLMNLKTSKKETVNYTSILKFAETTFLFHTKKVYLIVFVLIAGSLIFIPNIILDNNTLNYFKKESEVRKRADFFKKYSNGIQSFYIVIESNKKGAFKEWQYLHQLEKIEKFIKDKTKFNYSLSIADNLSLVNQEMHRGDKKFFRVPKTKAAIYQNYLFFHRKDVRRYVDEKYRVAKIDVWHNIFSSNQFNREKRLLENYFHSIEKELGVKIYITGKNVLLNKAADTISVGQTFSIGTTLLLVFLLISAVFKTFRAGVLIILGNAVPIITLFGLMGLLNIPLNVVTAIIATITFGIVVDDTIHLMMRYRYEHNNLFSKKRAILNSIEGEGRAVLLTTISLMIGYLTLATSQFIPVIEFALLSIFTIFIAVLSDLFVVPALLRRIDIIDKN